MTDPSRRGASTGRASSSGPWSATNIVALVVAVVSLATLAVVFADDATEPPAEPVEELVAAYERSRAGTYVVEAEFTRTMADGRQLQSAALIAQRAPDDELRWELGSAGGRIDGRQINCTPDGPDGSMRCAPSGPAEPWEERTAREVANLRSYFAGPTPVYRVEHAGPGCFRLVQTLLSVPDAPYGRETTMCFDPDTGAMSDLRLAREGGSVDTLRALTVRSEVDDADFSLEDAEPFQPTPSES